MKATHFLALLAVAAVAAAGGWFAARKSGAPHTATAAPGGRKVLYYQSSMHPWIKADKPGKCTICGMDLVPVYEGDKGFDSAAGVTSLASNTISVIHVQSEPVRRQALQRTMRVAGVIDDNDARHRRISAYIDGRIDQLQINYVGAEVVAGQPLATLYSPMLLAAERDYLTLLQQKTAGTSTNFQTEQARMLQAAAQRLKRFGLGDAQIAGLAGKGVTNATTEILAPLSGTVVERAVYEGQYVKEGDKLFEIADFSTMWFRFDAYERDLAWIRTGQVVQVTTPARPGRTYTAPIAFIDPNLNEMTRSAKVRVELPNPVIEENGVKRRELFHKLYAEAAVQVEIPEVLAVPRTAVLSPGGQPIVYVDQGGGNYSQRPIKLGRHGDNLAEVLEGLKEGEKVVTTGNLLIDAQAQLNQAAHPAAAAPAPSIPAPAALTPEQEKAAQEFMSAIHLLTRALASDNLAEFNQQAVKLQPAVPALQQAFSSSPEWAALIESAVKSATLKPATDMPAARKQFQPLSTAVVELARQLRRLKSFGSVRIFTCPMANQAVPGTPKDGYWIQLDATIKNPFFGKEMLDCGSEVKP
jgi:Cu(I)/Ag(I) efflux system membrane fusion protein